MLSIEIRNHFSTQKHCQMTIIIDSYLHPTCPSSHLNIPTHEVDAFVHNLKTTTLSSYWWGINYFIIKQMKYDLIIDTIILQILNHLFFCFWSKVTRVIQNCEHHFNYSDNNNLFSITRLSKLLWYHNIIIIQVHTPKVLYTECLFSPPSDFYLLKLNHTTK